MGWNYVLETAVTTDKSVVCLGEAVTYTASVRKRFTSGSREGEVVDVTDEVTWRSTAEARGRTYTKVWRDRRNTRVSVYYEGWPVDHADVTVICCALGKTPGASDYSDDELYLARMILGEAAGCSRDEQVAVGYVAANRARFKPQQFGASIKDVTTRPGQFLGMKVALAKKTDGVNQVQETLSPKECQKLREALDIARSVLSDSGSQREPLFTNTGQHAFYFNQSRSQSGRPDGDKSPRIHTKGQLGFAHSFYTSKR